MKEKRKSPREVAKLRGNIGWFKRIHDNEKTWINEIIVCLSAVSDPSYYIVAQEILLELGLSVSERSVVRFLKRKVEQCRHEKSQQK